MKALDLLIALVGKDLCESDIVLGSTYINLINQGFGVAVLKGNIEPNLYFQTNDFESVKFENEPDVIISFFGLKKYLWKIEA